MSLHRSSAGRAYAREEKEAAELAYVQLSKVLYHPRDFWSTSVMGMIHQSPVTTLYCQ